MLQSLKIGEIFTVDLTSCSKCQIDGEDFVKFYGLLRKHELYLRVASEHSVLTNETSNLSLQVTLSHIFLGDTMGLQEVLKDFFCVDAPIHFLRDFSETIILFKLKDFLLHSNKTEYRNQKYIFRINLNSLQENLRRHELKMSVLKLFSGGLFLIYAICPCRVPSNYLLLSLYHTALGHSMRFLDFFFYFHSS